MTTNSKVAFILRYFTEFSSFRANYVRMVEGRPTLHITWNRNLVPNNLVSGNSNSPTWVTVIITEITKRQCMCRCRTSRGHLSDSWASVVHNWRHWWPSCM